MLEHLAGARRVVIGLFSLVIAVAAAIGVQMSVDLRSATADMPVAHEDDVKAPLGGPYFLSLAATFAASSRPEGEP